MSKKTYETRKSQGICVRCGKIKAVSGRVMCSECAEKSRIETREKREFMRNMGICPRCCKNKLFGSEKECPECSAMMYERNRKNAEIRNACAADYYRKDIARLKSEGLCRGCRKRKVAAGKTYCPICLTKKRERGRIYRREKDNAVDRSERPNYGLCYTCGEPLDREGRICTKCVEKMTANPTEHRDNLAWRNDNKLIFGNGGRK